MQPDEKIPFTAHLEELRKRLIVCFIAIGIGFFAAYGFKEELFKILMRPLIAAMAPGEKLIFTGIAEAFFCYLKVAFLAGILMAVPVIMYELWLFIAPGLHTHEKRFLAPLVILSSFFFMNGTGRTPTVPFKSYFFKRLFMVRSLRGLIEEDDGIRDHWERPRRP